MYKFICEDVDDKGEVATNFPLPPATFLLPEIPILASIVE
jgi:hypothetical protein